MGSIKPTNLRGGFSPQRCARLASNKQDHQKESIWKMLRQADSLVLCRAGPGVLAEVNACCGDSSQRSVIAVLTCLVVNYKPAGLCANLRGAPWKKRQKVVQLCM